MDTIFTKDQVARPVGGGPSKLVLYVCWACERLAFDLGRNSSHGPYCECGERMESVNVIA